MSISFGPKERHAFIALGHEERPRFFSLRHEERQRFFTLGHEERKRFLSGREGKGEFRNREAEKGEPGDRKHEEKGRLEEPREREKGESRGSRPHGKAHESDELNQGTSGKKGPDKGKETQKGMNKGPYN